MPLYDLSGDPLPPHGLLQTIRNLSRLDVLSARVDAYEHASDWLALVLALVGIGFGALITLVVIFFALRTERSAVAAAKDEIRQSKAEIDGHIKTVTDAVERVAGLLEEMDAQKAKAIARSGEIESQAERIREIVDKAESRQKIDGASPALTPDERNTLTEAAQDIKDKNLAELSPQEIRLLVIDARENKDAFKALDLSRSMRTLSINAEDIADAMLNEGISLGDLRKYAESAAVFEEMTQRFADVESVKLKAKLDSAIYNMAVAYQLDGDTENALKKYGTIIERYERDKRDIASTSSVAKAYCNRGIQKKHASKFEDALADYNRSITISGVGKKPGLLEPAVKARVAKVEVLINLKRYAEAVRTIKSLLRIDVGDDPGLIDRKESAKKTLERIRNLPDG